MRLRTPSHWIRTTSRRRTFDSASEKTRQPAAQGRAAARSGAARSGSPAPVAAGPSAGGRVSPAAWSTFEGRVRGRRAERAVAEAHEALGRGDAEAARAALAELDAVSPGDPRRDAIAASLEQSSVQQAPAATPPAASATRPPAPAPDLQPPWRAQRSPLHRRPVLRRDLVHQRTWPRPQPGPQDRLHEGRRLHPKYLRRSRLRICLSISRCG